MHLTLYYRLEIDAFGIPDLCIVLRFMYLNQVRNRCIITNDVNIMKYHAYISKNEIELCMLGIMYFFLNM